ncbi:MAG: hypothetical protein C0407_17800, partial [Desulfobacca sp.]|nr:hypothetical protein [Desulfobacca sp.]
MKRLFALCLVVAGFSFLIFYPAVLPAQTTKSAPGLYVSGWPAFTITYPADWVELPPERMQIFRVAPPGPVPLPALTISVFSNTLPLESTPSMIVPVFERIGKNVKVLNKKTTRLKDGVPAFEAELEWELTPVGKVNTLLFSTAK